MMRREIRPPLTPEESHEADQVYGHAIRRNVQLVARHPVKVRVRCNQVASDMRSVCDFESWIETTAIAAEGKAANVLRGHLRSAHPSLTSQDIESLVGRRITSLRDLPIVSPRRSLA